MTLQLQSAIGLVALPFIAWVFSENRAALSWRAVIAGILLQFAFAALFLKVPGSERVFLFLNDLFLSLGAATREGTKVVFGYLGGADVPFEVKAPGASFILAFQALPIILVMSALSAVLFHWRVLQAVVSGFSFLLRRAFGLSGPVGVAAAANIFVGMVEAPLLVRPYLKSLSRSELFMVMTTGMATIAGTVLVLYASLIGSAITNAAGHLIAASVISAPAAILIALIMVPPSGTSPAQAYERASQNAADEGKADLEGPGQEARPVEDAQSSMDALTRGTAAGLQLYLNIIALLVVFVALVALTNQLLALLPPLGGEALSLQRLLGWLFAPVVWTIGVPWDEAATAGSLMGIKTVLNEFLAFLQLAGTPAEALSERSRLIMTYALCGFANFGSLAIMLAGLTTMVPERREELQSLGLRTILSGTLATLMTGAVVGVLTPG